jgi:hypothetical protein
MEMEDNDFQESEEFYFDDYENLNLHNNNLRQ